ncbi:hypothetical protein Arad_3646 [Rhizobium rhizogenes K84]|uniref:Uncharacterized protein n=1 Tax=Rhizobium rhizogenes (strain K84 / ATCC BAA-868) TaxID=311403 RepID=B9J9E6_RHIR8|nr:hypothetical protein Arad_3646 [Rhizobium rhizogenes K84]
MASVNGGFQNCCPERDQCSLAICLEEQAGNFGEIVGVNINLHIGLPGSDAHL